MNLFKFSTACDVHIVWTFLLSMTPVRSTSAPVLCKIRNKFKVFVFVLIVLKVFVGLSALETMPSRRLGQVDSPYGQVNFHPHCPTGKESVKLSANKNIKRAN